MLRRRPWLVLAILLLIPLGHGILNSVLLIRFDRLTAGVPIKLGQHQTTTGHRLDLIGLYGNVFDPKKRSKDINFDLVPVTCFIAPINVDESEITWQHNDLLRSALQHTAMDPSVFQQTVHELIVTMSESGSLIRYFLYEPPESYKAPDYELRKILKAYFWDIPRDSEFGRRTGIEKMAALPIFSPEHAKFRGTVQDRLAENLQSSIERLFSSIELYAFREINTIAFAALAGTSRRIDSHNFLDYRRSFWTIYQAIVSARIPLNVDKVYLVVYDSLPTQAEERDALEGLFEVYRYAFHFDLPIRDAYFAPELVRALPLLSIFLALLMITHPRLREVLVLDPAIDRNVDGANDHDEDYRVVFFLRNVGVFCAVIPIVTIANQLVLRLMSLHFGLVLLGEIGIVIILFCAIRWANRF